jgi:hypothetical protein
MTVEFASRESGGAADPRQRELELRKKFLNEWLCWLLEKFD